MIIEKVYFTIQNICCNFSPKVVEGSISKTASRRSKVLLFALLATAVSANTMSKEALKSVAEGNLLFSKDVYQVISKKQTGNIFISPLSVEVVLALVHAGARGETARQIATALHLPEDTKVVHAGFHELMSDLKGSKNVTLEIANKVFSQENYSLLEEFRSVAEKSFLSGAEQLNFADSAGAAKTINSWVEEKTKNKIKELISPDMLNGLTRLVLVNAIYFKGFWKNQFDKASTDSRDFFISKTEKKKVPMMSKKAKFGFTRLDELDATALEMPYQGDKLSMIILLPNEIDGIAKLESKLADVNLSDVLKSFHVQEVSVTIPKFKLEHTTDFNEILVQMGMKDMFNEADADFSGISGTKDLFVSQVIQKAFIEVNEEGSEAAAATAGVVRRKRSLMENDPIEFIANHPFVFILHVNEVDLVLFIGRFREHTGNVNIHHEEL